MEIDPQLLLQAAAEAAKNAHAPYSNYQVGSAVLAEDGAIFPGCNVENASYGLTNCAERTAIFSAVAKGQRTFKAVAIVASGNTIPYPCGACRQVLSEFCEPATPVYVASISNPATFDQITLGELLPKSFRF